MAVRDDGLARRWLVAVELANLRNRAGLNQAVLASALDVSPGMISHLEKYRYLATESQIKDWGARCGTDPAAVERLVRFASAGRPDHPSWLSRWENANVIAPFTRRYLGAEGFASRMFSYAQVLVPGLLQTPEYAAGITAPSARVRPDQEHLLVDLRIERQQRVLDGDLRFTAVIEEDVLDRPIGGPDAGEVMNKQLRHLMEMAQRDNCDVLIIPRSVGRHDGLEGRFVVLYFEDTNGGREAGPIAYLEVPDDALYVTEQDRVASFTRSSAQLVQVAYSQADSLKAIEERLAA